MAQTLGQLLLTVGNNNMNKHSIYDIIDGHSEPRATWKDIISTLGAVILVLVMFYALALMFYGLSA